MATKILLMSLAVLVVFCDGFSTRRQNDGNDDTIKRNSQVGPQQNSANVEKRMRWIGLEKRENEPKEHYQKRDSYMDRKYGRKWEDELSEAVKKGYMDRKYGRNVDEHSEPEKRVYGDRLYDREGPQPEKKAYMDLLFGRNVDEELSEAEKREDTQARLKELEEELMNAYDNFAESVIRNPMLIGLSNVSLD